MRVCGLLSTYIFTHVYAPATMGQGATGAEDKVSTGIHIFSNELPNLSYASMDRWKIWIIEDVPIFGQQFRRLSVDEVVNLQCQAK